LILTNFVHTPMLQLLLGPMNFEKDPTPRPPMLNTDFEATVVIRMANTIRVIWASIGNLVEFTFHQFKISKFSFGFSISSIKYRFNSDLC
jgi:hypothetical protein